MRPIDADALVYELTEMVRYNTGEYKHGIAAARLAVMNAPTIDAVPVRHGRWEYIPSDGKFRAILVCSRCKRNVGEYNRFNYCPHCGAKMDLEEKHHDEP